MRIEGVKTLYFPGAGTFLQFSAGHQNLSCYPSPHSLPRERQFMSQQDHNYVTSVNTWCLYCADSRPANEPAGNSAASYSSGPCHVELAGSNSFKAKSVSPAQHARSSDVESFAAPELAVRPCDAWLAPRCNSDNECNGCL